ncbi:MAG: DUF1566 domain-containing protein [Pelobacteraceae bacterium]
MRIHEKFIFQALMITMLMVMSGCGGGSGGGTDSGGGGVTSYTITGTVTANNAGLSSVTVTLSGSGSTTTTTDTSGNYTFSGAQNGSYTITPGMTGYTFTPASQSVTVSGANVTGASFTATAIPANTYTISGTITTGGTALAGVTVALSGNGSTTTTTNASGTFTFSGAQNGSYTITPSMTGYTFTPASQSVTVSGANVTGAGFTATATGGGPATAIQLPQTGQTFSDGFGDDGNLKRGAAWPIPRFTDNLNGTVTDNLTGLIWLKNANSFGAQPWASALTLANTLASGSLGLSDGSIAGQWRLPNINELESLLDISHFTPALPAGNPFTGVTGNFWSSSSLSSNAMSAWYVDMNTSGVGYNDKKFYSYYVWPVRAGL